ncbi:hypothetical protein [Nocardia cyriacigeorgica]|uniref:hypothetical protein n=1 Tax=Nocardia cyriacigeorgica TaxID=135487 RepID=UPI0011095ECB|nr:hypothetical protein [Nocardia cyriacigeorgica]TLF57010.1 hypothetical protein FEK31_15300 [Nocardia cyriacigeorgica]
MGEVLLAVEYSDNFDRANGALGANWAAMGAWPPAVINGTRLSAERPLQTISAGRLRPATFRRCGPTRKKSNSSLSHRLAPALSIGGDGFVRANSTGDRVDLIVADTAVHIMTRIGSNTVIQATASGLPAIASGTVFKLRAVGNVYTGYRAGVQVVQWTDTGGLIAIGSGTRYAGVICIEQKNQLGTPSRGWAIDNWIARGKGIPWQP